MKKLIVIISLGLIMQNLLFSSQSPCDNDCGSEIQTLIFSGSNPVLFENNLIKCFVDVTYTIQECQDGSYNISIKDLSINHIMNGDINNLELNSLYKFIVEFALKNLTSFNGSSNAMIKVPCYEKLNSDLIQCDSKSCCDLQFNYSKELNGSTVLESVEGDCENPNPNDFITGRPILSYDDCSNLCYWQTDGNEEDELPDPREHFIGPKNGSDFIFKTGGMLANNDNQERMRLTANGNLGIGITNPTTKLGVAGDTKVLGTIYANELIIEDTEIYWPDYVFSDTYKRLSLYEIENFIIENGHLPRIPSRKEIQENGIQLKEMNLLMMEKIEELTLELIALNKELQTLKNEVEK